MTDVRAIEREALDLTRELCRKPSISAEARAPDNPVCGGSAAHAPNEHVRVEDFAPAIKFTLAVLDELGS